jgi:lipoate synthase
VYGSRKVISNRGGVMVFVGATKAEICAEIAKECLSDEYRLITIGQELQGAKQEG